jgi:hypothetical protein
VVVSKLGLLLAITVGFLTVVAFTGVLSLKSDSFEARFDRTREGMTTDEIEAIFQCPPSVEFKFGPPDGDSAKLWATEDYDAWFAFDSSGKVTRKACGKLKPTLWERSCEWIGITAARAGVYSVRY